MFSGKTLAMVTLRLRRVIVHFREAEETFSDALYAVHLGA